MRRISRRSMGDSASTNLFEEGLQSFKTTLIDLYRKKTLLISQRETLRFRYATAYKAKLESIIGEIFTKLYELNDPVLFKGTAGIVGGAQQGIPMFNLQGQRLDNWGQLPFAIGGRLNPTMIAPIANIISLPYNGPESEDQRPSYKIHNYDINVETQYSPYWLRWPIDFYDRPYLPPTQERFDSIFNDPNVSARYNDVVALLIADWPSGSFVNTVNEMKEVIDQIIQKTKEIIRIQIRIDQNEADLGSFIEQYKDYAGSSYNLSDVLMNIDSEAKNANVVKAPDVPVGATVVEATVAPVAVAAAENPNTMIAESAVAQTAQPKTNPMLYAVAGIVALLLIKGK